MVLLEIQEKKADMADKDWPGLFPLVQHGCFSPVSNTLGAIGSSELTRHSPAQQLQLN